MTPFRGLGRKLGYPTANLRTRTESSDGVYFGYASLGRFARQPALIFVGTPTTVGDTEPRVEAHVLDIPDVDYYGLKLELEIWHFHRSNRTFDLVADLMAAMAADEAAARQLGAGAGVVFTGIITDVGRILRHRAVAEGLEVTFERPAGWGDLGLGESVATNGVCLTVASLRAGEYDCLLMPETLVRSTLGRRVPERVKIDERHYRLP